MKIRLGALIAFLLFSPARIIAQDVGVGTTDPKSNLHIFGGSAGTINPFRPLLIENSNNAYINLLTPTEFESGIRFGNQFLATAGAIIYKGSSFAADNGINFRTGGNTTRMNLNLAGFLGIGNSNPGYILDASQRIRIRSGGSFSFSSGIWLNNPLNTDLRSFIGIENDSYTGIFNFTNGFSFGVNSSTGDVKIMTRLGIGTPTPTAPLSFPASYGKKITLYPGAPGDFGIAVQPDDLQIYSDNENSDIGFGYDQGGTFTEKFRFKGNGAFALSGNTGAANQVLTSGGSGAAQFQSLSNLYKIAGTAVPNNVNDWAFANDLNSEMQIPELTCSITVGQPSRLMISASAHFLNICSGSDCIGTVRFYFKVDGAAGKEIQLLTTAEMRTVTIPGFFYDVAPGAHTVTFWFKKGVPGDNNLRGNAIISSVLAVPLP